MTRIALTDKELYDLARFVDLFQLIRLFSPEFVAKVRAARKRMEKASDNPL